MHIVDVVNTIVKMLAILFWISVGYIYLLGLCTTLIKNYFLQKEAWHKRMLQQDDVEPKLVSKQTHYVGNLQ